MPIKVTELELSHGLKPIRVEECYDDLYALVRFHGKPLGWLTLPVEPPVVTVDQLRRILQGRFSKQLVPLALGSPSREERANDKELPISVVVCTRNRSVQLVACLEALTALDYENYEVIIVDNAPTDKSTAEVCSRFPVRYVCEKRPGLDWARNRGITEAAHGIVAFTDDDARPDRGWLKAIGHTFSDPEIMAVTGLVLPVELDTDAQVEFEINYGGMSHGFRRRRLHRSQMSDEDILWASSFGVGANMAFRKMVFQAIGNFDVALDVGTPSGGGGDVEMFHRVAASDFTLVYEPSALVWHTHRRDRASLGQQLYQNGTGFGCYLLTSIRNKRVSAKTVVKFGVRRWFVGWIVRRMLRRGNLSRRYVLQEFRGALKSPFAYVESQRHAAKIQEEFIGL